MGITLVTGPKIEPVELREVKLHLRQDSSSDDVLIQNLIVAARETAQVKTGRQLLTAIYDYTLDAFPACDFFTLPWPPLQSVTSIAYLDENNISQPLANTVYEYDITVEPGIVRLKYDQTWPNTIDHANAVTIRYTCGWLTAAAIPYSLKAWLNLYVSHLYDNREMLNIGNLVNELPFFDCLLNQHKVFKVV